MKRGKKLEEFIEKFNRARETAGTIGKAIKESGATKKISEGISNLVRKELMLLNSDRATVSITDSKKHATDKNQPKTQKAEVITEQPIITINFRTTEDKSPKKGCTAKYTPDKNTGVVVLITGPTKELRYLYNLGQTQKATCIGFETINRSVENYYQRELKSVFMDTNTWNKISLLNNIRVIYPEIEKLKKTDTEESPSKVSINIHHGKEGLESEYHIN